MQSNDRVCRDHHKLILHVDRLAAARPGQFVHILHAGRGEQPTTLERTPSGWPALRLAEDREIIVRRAYSIAGVRQSPHHVEVDIIYRVVGKATRWMSTLQPGDSVSVLGPLGNGFWVPEGKRLALLVAGGVGLPPMIWWAEELTRRRIETVAFIGAQQHGLFPLRLERIRRAAGSCDQPCAVRVVEFDQLGVEAILTTDDGSLGTPGYVTGALQDYVQRRAPAAAEACVYTCGPEAMMRAVANLCAQWHIDCQLCMERSMACGMGTCQSCVVAVADDHADSAWRYALCCTEGPVFESGNILWTVPRQS